MTRLPYGALAEIDCNKKKFSILESELNDYIVKVNRLFIFIKQVN